MSQKDKDIQLKLRGFIKDHSHQQILAGVVKAVHESDWTVDVELTMDESEEPTEGIMLQPILTDEYGIIKVPKLGSDCVVVAVDGMADFMLIHATEYEKLIIKIGDRSLELNSDMWNIDGGNNGTVPISSKTVGRLNKLENDVNSLKQLLTTAIAAMAAGQATPVVSGSALYGYFSPFTNYAAQQLQPTQDSDIENPKIKH